MSSGLALEMQRVHGGGWKRYPAYRDSGVEWLGAVPEGWDVKRLKYLASESLKYGANESAELDDPDLPRYIRITDIAENGSLRVDTFKSLPEDVARPYLLKSGDILFARSGATVGKSFMYHESWGCACYAGYLIRLRVNYRVAAPEFISYFASSSAYWDWVSSIFIQATIQNISAEKYANFYVAIPPLPEQHTIAAFLDRETGHIDALIAKKERQIELLQEKRAALISHAVTKGLDPDAPMKDSGVEWMGEIPAQWEVKRLRHITHRLGVGLVIKPSTYVDEDGDVPFFFGSDVREFRLLPEGARRITHESNEKIIASKLRAGDIVTVRVGAPGVSAVVPTELDGANCASIMITRRSLNFDSRWLCYVYNSAWGKYQVDRVAYGAAQKQFNIGHAVDFVYPVPPREEQTEISDLLDVRNCRHDVLMLKLEKSIDKLREYRTTIVSAAVTGKIDVRKEVSHESC